MDSSLTIGNETERLSIDDETHTCERCSLINFESLEKTEPDVGATLLVEVQDLSQPLTDRHCPTCQILQTALDLHRSRYASARVWWDRVIPATGFLGMITFEYLMGDAFERLKPDLMVSDVMARRPHPETHHAPRRVDFGQAKTWIDACKKSHPDCNAHSSKALKSLRVIDCVTRSVVSAPEDCVYVALSYVWGTSKTCDAPGSSALLDQLPLTVDNSIHATLMLGYRYLWIDKYCIDQTSAADKHDQINQMGDIYSSAELTLIAAAGANSEYGLPGVERDREHLGRDVTIGRLRFVTTYGWNISEIHDSVWSSRAWTFQEGYTSRRRLYFTDTRLIYICDCDKNMYCDAETDSERAWYGTLGHLSDSLPVKDWQVDPGTGFLREYTRRKLTFDSDALNGIVGVLNTLSKAESPIFHTWGVTFGGRSSAIGPPSLAIQLTWYHNAPCLRRKAFPSWSPLGWEGVADYGYRPTPVISQSFQVEVWDNSEFIQLSKVKQDLHQRSGAESLEKSRYLKITAKLGWVEVRYFSANALLSIDKSSRVVNGLPYLVEPRAGFHVRVSAGDDGGVYASMLPYWDSEPDLPLDLIRVPCTFIPEGDESKSMAVMMLRNHGTHYERVGHFDYLQTYAGRFNFLFKDDNGALTVEKVLEHIDTYSDEDIARDFDNPEMQTFLLG